jgi:hypothetical protein
MLFRISERLVNIDHYRKFNKLGDRREFEAENKEAAAAWGELRPLIRTPDGGGRVPAGCSLRLTPPSPGESKLPSPPSFRDHHEVFRFHETRHFRRWYF